MQTPLIEPRRPRPMTCCENVFFLLLFAFILVYPWFPLYQGATTVNEMDSSTMTAFIFYIFVVAATSVGSLSVIVHHIRGMIHRTDPNPLATEGVAVADNLYIQNTINA